MSERAITVAKLSRPRLPLVARRERLFRQLDALRDKPCTWLCGPPGSGKTTLVADYFQASGGTSYWYHVDEGDKDASATIVYLIALATRADPLAAGLPYLTTEHRADLTGFYRQFFRRFYQLLPQGCTIILDNCHRAAGESFHALLLGAIDEIPEGLRLIAVSRHQLPSVMTRCEANRQVSVIGGEDLRLEPEETRNIVQAMGFRMNSGVEEVHEMCNGWVAGLVLVLTHTMREKRHAPHMKLDRSSRESIFAYFANELFQSADPGMRDLLLRTSLLPSVTTEVARELTRNKQADELLDDLYRRNFFTVRRENGRTGETTSYAYHDLFRAFLLERVQHDLEPAELEALRGKVARLLELAGLVTEAIEQYQAIKKWDDIARLVLVDAQQLIDQGQLRTLSERLECLPADRISRDPWLLYYQGHVVLMSDPAQAREIFEAAYEMFVTESDETGQFSAAFATMETMMMSSVSYRPWDRWVDILGGLLESHPPEEPGMTVRAWHTLLYTALYRRPSHPLIGRAVAILDREVFAGRLPPAQTIQAATGLLAYAHFSCDEALAARVIPVLKQWLDGEQLAVMSRVLGATWIMVYHYFDAQYSEALYWAERTRDLAIRYGFGTLARTMAWYRVQSMAHLGQRDAALDEAKKLQLAQHDPKHNYSAAYAATAAAYAHFAAGDLVSAIEIGDYGLEAWRDNGFTLAGLAWAQSMQAVYWLAAAETGKAISLIEDAEAGLAGTVCNYPHALYALLRAQAAVARGDRNSAVRHLQDSLSVAENHKRIALLSWARPFLPGLFALAWEEGIARDKVAALIAEWNIPPPSPEEPNWPRPLEIRLFGAFEIRLDGRPLDFGRKPPRKMLALLKAIALSGERGLAIGKARDFFWADQDGDAAVAAQTAALYRLRKTLGSLDVVRLAEGRLMLELASVWVDAVAFERLAQSGDDRDALRAVSLYRGSLLPYDEEEPWITAARLRLRDVFSRLVERLAGPLEATDPDAAERLYLRGIEAEPLMEGSYRGLMRCLAAKDRSAEAAAVYRRLRQTLSVILGIEPSAETERLWKQLLGRS